MWRVMTGSNVKYKEAKSTVMVGDNKNDSDNSSSPTKTERNMRPKNRKKMSDSSQCSSCSHDDDSTPSKFQVKEKVKSKKKSDVQDSTSNSSNISQTNIDVNKKKKKKRSEKRNKSLNSSADVSDSSPSKVNQNKKAKILSKKVKVAHNVKQKKKSLSKNVDVSSEIEVIDVDNVRVVLTDCEFEKYLKNIKPEPIETDDVNIAEVENKTGESVSNPKTDQDKAKGKYAQLKKCKANKELEKNKESLSVKTVESGECKTSITTCIDKPPLHSTPNIERTCVSVREETERTPHQDNSRTIETEANVAMEMSSMNQNTYSDKKKRKIGVKDNEDITVSISEEYYSTQDESIDDGCESPYPSQKEENGVKSSMKRKRNDRKYRKKSKDKQGNVPLLANSDKAEGEFSKVDSSASNLEVGIGVLDIGEEPMEDEVLPEHIKYIPVDFHDDFHGVLILSQNQVVAMRGCMQLSVIYGEADISGYKMVPGKPYIDVFSVTTSSLFYIKDNTPVACTVELKEKLVEVLAGMFQSTKENLVELLGEVTEVYTCIVVRKIRSLLPALLKKLNNFSGFSRVPQFLPKPFKSGVLETGHWKVLLDQIQNEMEATKDDCTCSMMLCGAGNVGKSSLARYSINRMLEKHESVFFLDCDCGQSEFTPPSCLSLVKVTKPLIGLPFSHQLTPVRSFFYGHISPGDTPSEYIKLIGYLFQTYYVDYYSQGPLVINTQGWMQGLGLSLLVDVIRLTSPCHIVHISGHNAKSNVPTQLSEEFLQNLDGWDTEASYKCMKKGHGCKYHNLSTTEVQKSFKPGNKSRTAREQCITSYFSSLYQPYLDHAISNGEAFDAWIPPAMSTILPYVVCWKDVALHIMHETVTPDVMLFGFNLTLVGLARVDPELIQAREEEPEKPNYLLNVPVAEYIGFGIVRNIDEAKKLFYIISPEPVERLKNVNAILRGSAQLPTSYFLEAS